MCCRGCAVGEGALTVFWGFLGLGLGEKGGGWEWEGCWGYGRDGMARLLNADMTEWVALYCVRVFIF